jgi:beta-lactamase class A
MHEYRNLVRVNSTATKIKPLASPVPFNKYASGSRSWQAPSPLKSIAIGTKLFRCIEVAMVLTLLQGQFISSEHNSPLAQNVPAAAPLRMIEEDTTLEEKLKSASNLKGLRAGIFVVSPESGRYATLNGKDKFSAASIIKLPILVSLLAAVDSGEVKLDQVLTIREDLITGGSGILQWRPKGTKISVAETAELMMIVSDNTATNLLIDHLGGKARLNKQFTQWGLTETKINNWLADFEGTNTTSPYDLVYLMGRLDRGEILSKDSRDWLNKVMKRTRIRTLLPLGLPPGTVIGHKTGDIGGMVGDAGVVTTPDGGNYLIAVQVARPRNDRRANLLIRTISKLVYEDFAGSKSGPTLEPPVSPSEGPFETDAAAPHTVTAAQSAVGVKPAQHSSRRHTRRHSHRHTVR